MCSCSTLDGAIENQEYGQMLSIPQQHCTWDAYDGYSKPCVACMDRSRVFKCPLYHSPTSLGTQFT